MKRWSLHLILFVIVVSVENHRRSLHPFAQPSTGFSGYNYYNVLMKLPAGNAGKRKFYKVVEKMFTFVSVC